MSCPAASAAEGLDVLARVCQVIGRYVRPELGRQAESDSDLEVDLMLDGLDRQKIALDLDEAFGIEISDQQLEGWVTVGDVVATITRALEPA